MLASTKRIVFLVCGLLAFLLGWIGIFLPLLPTTPFMILAAYCFSNSSEKLHGWLLTRPGIGRIIVEWERYRVIRPKAKVFSISLMTLMMSYPLLFKNLPFAVKATILLVLVCVSGFILRCPSNIPESCSQKKNGSKVPSDLHTADQRTAP